MFCSWLFLKLCFGSLSSCKTCNGDYDFWHRAARLSLDYVNRHEISLHPVQIQDTQCRCSRSAPELEQSVLHVSQPAQCCFLGMSHFWVCEHTAEVPCQKVLVLSHLSIGQCPRSFIDCQPTVVVVVVLVIHFQQLFPPWSSPTKFTSAQKRRLVYSDADVPWP